MSARRARGKRIYSALPMRARPAGEARAREAYARVAADDEGAALRRLRKLCIADCVATSYARLIATRALSLGALRAARALGAV